MPAQTIEERRQTLDALDSKLRSKVIDPVKAAWTPQLAAAAKPVTDVWPDQIALASTAVQVAFARYRPLVDVEPPVRDRTAAVQAIDDAVRQLDDDLGATSKALIAAKTFKTESEKTTIDAARDTSDRAEVALTAWIGDFHRFDASIQPAPGPTPTGTPIETYATIADNNPYPLTIRATIANASDWASDTQRPDRSFDGVPIDAFSSVTARADISSTAVSAEVRLEVTVQGDPSKYLLIYDQTAALRRSISGQPVAVVGDGGKYVLYQTTRTTSTGKPELVLAITEQTGA